MSDGSAPARVVLTLAGLAVPVALLLGGIVYALAKRARLAAGP